MAVVVAAAVVVDDVAAAGDGGLGGGVGYEFGFVVEVVVGDGVVEGEGGCEGVDVGVMDGAEVMFDLDSLTGAYGMDGEAEVVVADDDGDEVVAVVAADFEVVAEEGEGVVAVVVDCDGGGH